MSSLITESRIDYGRQRDFVDPDRARALHVSIVGCGTVGSHAAHECARLGVGALHLVDDDVVAAHNLPSQRFALADLDRPKAEALAEGVSAISDHCRVTTRVGRLAGGEPLPAGVVVMAVDSMAARKDITDLSLAWRTDHPLVIELRMGGDNLQMLCYDPCDSAALSRYAGMWFPDEEASALPCGGRSVSYVGALAGALTAQAVKRHLGGEAPVWLTVLSMRDLSLQTFG